MEDVAILCSEAPSSYSAPISGKNWKQMQVQMSNLRRRVGGSEVEADGGGCGDREIAGGEADKKFRLKGGI